MDRVLLPRIRKRETQIVNSNLNEEEFAQEIYFYILQTTPSFHCFMPTNRAEKYLKNNRRINSHEIMLFDKVNG